ncbi:hypothetical protein GCM10012280_69210 [Wenjunlia tyrosinilytica]|uniref:Uncharacterized protein n=1 Tax=Wenjunlia tyrosinilytica TaxID=1544741 RepID=A0A918A0Z8_9ACTN|nr:hypothetical protein GCM10012280_69210 [Wenjunlia tyrosinilytica]
MRDGRPAIPLALITPINAGERERRINAAGPTLGDVRDVVAATAVAPRKAGDHRLHPIDDRDPAGPEDTALPTDGLHPSPAGLSADGRAAEPSRTLEGARVRSAARHEDHAPVTALCGEVSRGPGPSLPLTWDAGPFPTAIARGRPRQTGADS